MASLAETERVQRYYEQIAHRYDEYVGYFERLLVRAVDGAPAAATPTEGQAIAVGEEITLSAGDTIYYDAAVVQSERNDGDEDAVVLASNLRGVDEPARQFHEDMAASTPAA